MPKTKVELKSLSGKSIAIDAYNALYQFLAIIRQPDGTPLKDNTGRITSQLSGLFYRTANLVELNIKGVYVFDGVPPTLKEVEIKRRAKVKAEALIKYERALQEGKIEEARTYAQMTSRLKDYMAEALIKYERALQEGKIEEARTYAQMTSRLKDYMAEDSKRLLTQMGVPWVQAPSEGEAQAAYLAKKGDTNYCASQDYDSLLFGAPILVRNVTISGRRKLPKKPVYVEIVPEIMKLNEVLKELKITREQLIDIGVLVGTDFNPEGVKGIGPKTALKLIKQYGSLEKLLPTLKEAEIAVEPQRIREIFLNPKVTDNYKLTWREPDIEGVVDFLCRERDFSEERVRKALKKMTEGLRKAKGKVTLEKWFGA